MQKNHSILTPSELMAQVDKIHVDTPTALSFNRICSRLMEKSKKLEFPGGLILKGNSGTGKSHLARRFLMKNRPYDDDYKRRIPVLFMKLKSSPTTASIAKNILNQLGYPFDSSLSADDLIDPICESFKCVNLSLLIIDEAQHTFEGSKINSAVTICDWFKIIHSKSQVPLVFMGTERMYRMEELSEQLAQRLPARIHIQKLKGDEFASMYKGFISSLPIKVSKKIDTPIISRKVLKSCSGSRRSLKMLFCEATYQLATRNHDVLSVEDLSTAHNYLFDEKSNPF